MEIMEIIILIGVSIGIVALGFVGGNYTAKRNLIKDEGVDLVNQLFLLAKIITVKTIANEEDRSRINKIFDSIQDTFNFVHIMAIDQSDEEKMRIAEEEIIRKLALFNVTVNDDDLLIIRFIVSNFVALLPKN